MGLPVLSFQNHWERSDWDARRSLLQKAIYEVAIPVSVKDRLLADNLVQVVLMLEQMEAEITTHELSSKFDAHRYGDLLHAMLDLLDVLKTKKPPVVDMNVH